MATAPSCRAQLAGHLPAWCPPTSPLLRSRPCPCRLPGPPCDKAHGCVCRSPCRLRAGAEPPCLATFIPNHVPHVGNRQRGHDSRHRQSCCQWHVGSGWRGCLLLGIGCSQMSPPRPWGSARVGRMLPQGQEWAACVASVQAELGATPGTCRGGPCTSCCRAGPCLRPPLNQGRGLPHPAPSMLEGALSHVCPAGSRSPCPHPPWAGRCHSPSMATGHRPGHPGQCTVYVSLLLHQLVVAHSRTSVF